MDVKYNPGEFLPAFDDKASEKNEQNRVIIEDGSFRMAFTQIAGLIARRIVTDHPVGTTVHQCKRLGMIRFGSRVDLFLPLETRVLARVGDTTRVGVTVVAEWS